MPQNGALLDLTTNLPIYDITILNFILDTLMFLAPLLLLSTSTSLITFLNIFEYHEKSFIM